MFFWYPAYPLTFTVFLHLTQGSPSSKGMDLVENSNLESLCIMSGYSAPTPICYLIYEYSRIQLEIRIHCIDYFLQVIFGSTIDLQAIFPLFPGLVGIVGHVLPLMVLGFNYSKFWLVTHINFVSSLTQAGQIVGRMLSSWVGI